MPRRRTAAARALAAALVLAGLATPPGNAVARPSAPRSQSVQMHFTHWVVYASNSGASVKQNVPPGGTFHICSSSKLTRLDAHYRASGANNLAVRTVWKPPPPGPPSISQPGRAYPSGFFYITSPRGLTDGTWTLKVVRHGETLASSSVTIVKEHC